MDDPVVVKTPRGIELRLSLRLSRNRKEMMLKALVK